MRKEHKQTLRFIILKHQYVYSVKTPVLTIGAQ